MSIIPFIRLFVPISVFLDRKEFGLYNFPKFTVFHTLSGKFCDIKCRWPIVTVRKSMWWIIEAALKVKLLRCLVHFLQEIQYLLVVTELWRFSYIWALFNICYFFTTSECCKILLRILHLVTFKEDRRFRRLCTLSLGVVVVRMVSLILMAGAAGLSVGLFVLGLQILIGRRAGKDISVCFFMIIEMLHAPPLIIFFLLFKLPLFFLF